MIWAVQAGFMELFFGKLGSEQFETNLLLSNHTSPGSSWISCRYVSGRDPDVAQLEPYLVGTKEKTSCFSCREVFLVAICCWKFAD